MCMSSLSLLLWKAAEVGRGPKKVINLLETPPPTKQTHTTLPADQVTGHVTAQPSTFILLLLERMRPWCHRKWLLDGLSVERDLRECDMSARRLWPRTEKSFFVAAVYLCKRTMQNKQRLELADYEAENLARLQKMFSRKWEFIFLQAEAQAKYVVFHLVPRSALRHCFWFCFVFFWG